MHFLKIKRAITDRGSVHLIASFFKTLYILIYFSLINYFHICFAGKLLDIPPTASCLAQIIKKKCNQKSASGKFGNESFLITPNVLSSICQKSCLEN